MIYKNEFLYALSEAYRSIETNCADKQEKGYEFTEKRIVTPPPESKPKPELINSIPEYETSVLKISYYREDKNIVTKSIGTIFGFDLVITKTVDFTNRKLEEKNANTVAWWLQENLGKICDIPFFKRR